VSGLNQVLLHPDRRVGAALERWRQADLRGLGGSGFPVWKKWDAVAAETGKPDKYLVINGNEDEPGTLKDRLLLEDTPHQVIEGAVAAAVAVGANKVVFYINPDLSRSLAALKAALEQWQTADLAAPASAALGKPL
jgi:NADH-quinone oxidoreductase subunit F